MTTTVVSRRSRKLRGAARNLMYRRVLPASALVNLRVDSLAKSISDDELRGVADIHVLNASAQEVRSFIRSAGLERYSELRYLHSKPLEYFLTYRLWSEVAAGSIRLLDAAGGANAEYARLCRTILPNVVPISQDALLVGRVVDGVQFIGGGIDSIECPDGSIDVVTCHHSVEHFQENLDEAFVGEVMRILAPGGVAVIAPLFVSNGHVEVSNLRGLSRRLGATYDPTAAFAGWGPYEGFARVYSPVTLHQRLVRPAVQAGAHVSITRLLVDGEDVPDERRNRHQVKINRPLRALTIRKAR